MWLKAVERGPESWVTASPRTWEASPQQRKDDSLMQIAAISRALPARRADPLRWWRNRPREKPVPSTNAPCRIRLLFSLSLSISFSLSRRARGKILPTRWENQNARFYSSRKRMVKASCIGKTVHVFSFNYFVGCLNEQKLEILEISFFR